MKKIKILHLVPGLDAGGISVLLLNYYKKMQLKDTNIDNIKFYEYQNVEFGCGIYDFIDLVTKEEKYGSKLKQKMKNYLNK